ncbi:MAG TPA: peptidylprolyl isomerase, partial [Spirochaetaceae bacterium]|nr:peptidylprolyl isomerase [Spirochaetaceae bacterium]
VFDQSSLSGGPFSFTVGKGEVIDGWDSVVSTMQKGEKRFVIIPPELAYGAQSIGDVIPPNSFLAFEIELVSIRE